jgi:hypothetical protein
MAWWRRPSTTAARSWISKSEMKAVLDHKNQILLLLALCVTAIHFLSYAYGFHPFFFWSWPVVMLLNVSSFILAILCLAILVFIIIKKGTFLRYGFVWFSLTAAIVLVPGYYSEVAGALSALYLTGPERVFEEARSLIESCQQSPENCGPILDIPPAIQGVNPESVYVNDEFVVIGKLGMFHPDGFVIFLEGDGPSESMRVKRLGGDLYWTYGN